MLLTASRQLHEWRRELGDLEKLTISVNLSQKLLEQQDLPTQIDRMLREANVVITPGSGFGAQGEGYFRISAFNSTENAREVARRITSLR